MAGKFGAFLKSRKTTRQKNLVIAQVSDLIKAGANIQKLEDEFVRLNHEVWSDITTADYLWTNPRIKMHFRTCPDITYCAIEDGKVVATLSSIILTENEVRRNKSWLETTANGYLTTHRPDGDVLFGVDLTASKTASKGLADKLVMGGILVTVLGRGLRSVYLGSRIPGFRKYPGMDVREYVFGKRKNGKPLDPELYFYVKNGFEIIQIVPNYMHDPDSKNYGVLIRWTNPLYGLTRRMPFLRPAIRCMGKSLFLKMPGKGEGAKIL